MNVHFTVFDFLSTHTWTGMGHFAHFGSAQRARVVRFLRATATKYFIPLPVLNFLDAEAAFFVSTQPFSSTRNAWALISKFLLVGSDDFLRLESGGAVIRRYQDASMSTSFQLAVPADLFAPAVAEVCARVKMLFEPRQAEAVVVEFEAMGE